MSERRRLEQRQAAFMEIVKEIGAHDDVDRVLALIGRRACELIGVDAALVLVVEGDDLVLRASSGIPGLARGSRWRIADSRIGDVVRTGQLGTHDDAGDVVLGVPYAVTLQVPVILRGDTIGVLYLLRAALQAFSADDATVLASLAAHTAVALERARLVDALDTGRRHQDALLVLGGAANARADPTELLRRTARETARALDAETVAAYLVDNDARELRPVAGYRVPKDLLSTLTNLVIRLEGHTVLEQAWLRRETVSSTDVHGLIGLGGPTGPALPYRACVFVPIVIDNAPIGGLLALWADPARSLSADERRLVDGIAGEAAIMMDRARLQREVEQRELETATLAEIGRELSKSADVDQVVGLAMQPLRFLGETATLYWELSAKNAELKETTHALEAAVASRSEFLANISHEIRSPLNSILGLLRLVIDGMCSDDERAAFIGEAHANARHLLTLLNDILDMAKIEAGRLETYVEPVDLPAFLDGLRELVQSQAEVKGLRLVFEIDASCAPAVLADEQRLRQVMLNVLGNSIKFTESGSVTVRATVDADTVDIAVIDTGIGVPPEVQSRLFQKFVQADGSTTRRYGGSGLGLVLSKHLVELMKGTLTLASAGHGQGTTVTVRLPLDITGAPERR